jgi:hypothetical protein
LAQAKEAVQEATGVQPSRSIADAVKLRKSCPSATNVLTNKGPMSRWLKRLLFGIWGLLLIPLIVPPLEKWLEQNVVSNSNGVTATVLSNAMAVAALSSLAAQGHQRWFKFAVVFLTGVVVGVSIEWLSRKSDQKKAFKLRSLGSRFRTLSDDIQARAALSAWPDNVLVLKPAIRSALISAHKAGLWVPNEHIYQLPDASFLCEYFKSVGKLLEDGYFDKANHEAVSWKPFLGKPS